MVVVIMWSVIIGWTEVAQSIETAGLIGFLFLRALLYIVLVSLKKPRVNVLHQDSIRHSGLGTRHYPLPR